MQEFDLEMTLASEMVRILGAIGMKDREAVRDPEKALEILINQSPGECSATYGDVDRCMANALALQMFFSIFWGEKLDIKSTETGCIDEVKIDTHHCTDKECCGPLPVWLDDTFEHDHHH